MKLRLYILPAAGNGSDEGFKRAAESFGNTIQLQTTRICGSQLYLAGVHYAPWYGYIYDDEMLSPKLRDALPIIMNHEKNDVYVFYKQKDLGGGVWEATRSPRIFRSHVALQPEKLIPMQPGLKHEHILDGFILEQ